ncbi:MAG: hypothetical protein FWE61_02060, partial [Micrococcales bacterium]|nr:hypothetical protein [Micrococcales bacterium]
EDFSRTYCSVYKSSPIAGGLPDRNTREGAAAILEAYTSLAAVAPPDAEKYFTTLVEYFTLVTDALDPTSPTRRTSLDKTTEMEELRHNAELMLLDATLAACLFS